MGLFGSNKHKTVKEMSDSEIIRQLKKKNLDIATRAKLIMEAQERGLDIPAF